MFLSIIVLVLTLVKFLSLLYSDEESALHRMMKFFNAIIFWNGLFLCLLFFAIPFSIAACLSLNSLSGMGLGAEISEQVSTSLAVIVAGFYLTMPLFIILWLKKNFD